MFHTVSNTTAAVSLFTSLLNHLHRLCICYGNFHLNTGFDADGGDLLDDFRRAVQIDQALVNPHLEAIPGLGSLTAGGLSSGDAQSLGWGREIRM